MDTFSSLTTIFTASAKFFEDLFQITWIYFSEFIHQIVVRERGNLRRGEAYFFSNRIYNIVHGGASVGTLFLIHRDVRLFTGVAMVNSHNFTSGIKHRGPRSAPPVVGT